MKKRRKLNEATIFARLSWTLKADFEETLTRKQDTAAEILRHFIRDYIERNRAR